MEEAKGLALRERVQIHDGWRFHRGELPVPPARGSSKAGGCGSVSDLTAGELPVPDTTDPVLESMLPGFSEMSRTTRPDSLGPGWVDVRLPHDWRIAEPANPQGPIWQAFRPGGVAYYRRRFTHPASALGLRTMLEFEGVMRDTTVWCNGFLLGDHLSGYTPFRLDLTELLRYADEGDNVLLVRCDSTWPEGWWYEGGGIYRNVWLTTHAPIHVDHDGVWVTTPKVSPERASVSTVATVRNQSAAAVTPDVTIRIAAPDGPVLASSRHTVVVPPSGTAQVSSLLTVTAPRLWDIHDGQLHTVSVSIHLDGDEVDRTETLFGIRSVEFRDAAGLFVNGQRVRLQGANIHQDFAGLGVGLPDRIIEHKLRLLAEMGCNAVRSAHHPSSPSLLDAADRLGLLVIAENRLLSSAPPYLEDLRSLVVEGRNHPSVFMWSLENEEYLQGTPRGARLLQRLVEEVCQLDPTRPTTVGGPKGFDSAYFDIVDVIGTHYQSLNQLLGEVQALRPHTPHVADEEGLFPTVRGQYEDDHARGLVSSFGTTMGLYGAFPKIVAHLRGQGPIEFDHGATWRWFLDHPESGGGFVWAGIDYFGEPTPMAWPVHISNYGAMDICGFPKDYYWLLRSFFRPEPLVHALPHWTWPSCEGKPIRLWVYSNCDEVELVLNGNVLDRRPVVDHVVRWDDGIIYEPGCLTFRGISDGEVVAQGHSETAGPAHRLVLAATPETLNSGGDDVAIMTVEVVDMEGRLCPWADDDICFDVTGPGEVIGVGNGDPTSLEPHVGGRRRAFHGRAVAIVRSLPDGSGDPLHVRASAPRLQEASVAVPFTPPTDR